jgi:hypothetical protein
VPNGHGSQCGGRLKNSSHPGFGSAILLLVAESLVMRFTHYLGGRYGEVKLAAVCRRYSFSKEEFRSPLVETVKMVNVHLWFVEFCSTGNMSSLQSGCGHTSSCAARRPSGDQCSIFVSKRNVQFTLVLVGEVQPSYGGLAASRSAQRCVT